MKAITALTFFSLVLGYAFDTYADTFGSGANTFDIEFVSIGNPNNPDDTTLRSKARGKVEYAYRMGKYEISRDMITKANADGGLGITMAPMDFVIGGPRDDMPATGITWFEAATFVNWLNTSTGHTPAYKFNGSTFELWLSGDAGYNPANPFRNSRAFYFLPSVDEWFKAAYYDPIADVYYLWPLGSNSLPTPVASGTAAGTAVYIQDFFQGPADITLAGGPSPYGTVGQGGNVSEWHETETDLVNDSSSARRFTHGGYWGNHSDFLLKGLIANGLDPTLENNRLGFRVASIPEPSTLVMGAMAGLGLIFRRRRRSSSTSNPPD